MYKCNTFQNIMTFWKFVTENFSDYTILTTFQRIRKMLDNFRSPVYLFACMTAHIMDSQIRKVIQDLHMLLMKISRYFFFYWTLLMLLVLSQEHANKIGCLQVMNGQFLLYAAFRKYFYCSKLWQKLWKEVNKCKKNKNKSLKFFPFFFFFFFF